MFYKLRKSIRGSAEGDPPACCGCIMLILIIVMLPNIIDIGKSGFDIAKTGFKAIEAKCGTVLAYVISGFGTLFLLGILASFAPRTMEEQISDKIRSGDHSSVKLFKK